MHGASNSFAANWNILMQRSGFGLWKIRWSVLFEAEAHIIRGRLEKREQSNFKHPLIVLSVGSDQRSPPSYVIAICECETNNSSDGQRPFSLRDRPSVGLWSRVGNFDWATTQVYHIQMHRDFIRLLIS